MVKLRRKEEVEAPCAVSSRPPEEDVRFMTDTFIKALFTLLQSENDCPSGRQQKMCILGGLAIPADFVGRTIDSLTAFPALPALVSCLASLLLRSFRPTLLSESAVFLVDRTIPWKMVTGVWFCVPDPEHVWNFLQKDRIFDYKLEMPSSHIKSPSFPTWQRRRR